MCSCTHSCKLSFSSSSIVVFTASGIRIHWLATRSGTRINRYAHHYLDRRLLSSVLTGGNAQGTRVVCRLAATVIVGSCCPLYLQTCSTCMDTATATLMTELPAGKVCSPRANLGLVAYTEWHGDWALPWPARILAACLTDLLGSSRSLRWPLGNRPSGPCIRAVFLLYGCWTKSTSYSKYPSTSAGSVGPFRKLGYGLSALAWKAGCILNPFGRSGRNAGCDGPAGSMTLKGPTKRGASFRHNSGSDFVRGLVA